jgi:hypothetical protein
MVRGISLNLLFLLTGLLALAACATEPVDDGAGKFVDMPVDWDEIDLAEADLNLPLVVPLEIASLGRRVGEGQVFENLYTFHGVKGYVLTSRVAFGSWSERYTEQLGSLTDFKDYTKELSLPPGGQIDVRWAKPFLNGKFAEGQSLSRGFVSREASAPPYFDRCFVARTAYQLVDYASIERAPGAVDTVVEVLLCGALPEQNLLEAMLVKVQAVENRAAFREELSRRTVGTI